MKNGPQRLPQQAVRVGAFERRMDEIHAEIEGRQKDVEWRMSCVLAEYHEQFTEVLERRIAELETPWWKRLWLKMRGWAAGPGSWFATRSVGAVAQKAAGPSAEGAKSV